MKIDGDTPRVLKSAIAFATLAACSSVSPGTDAGRDLGPSDDVATERPTGADAVDVLAPDVPRLACHLGEVSDLPGVTIHVLRDDCVFTTAQARAGISIPYDVVIDHDVEVTVAPSPGSYCYAPDPSGLLILEALTGGGQNYCLCDRGLPYSGYCQTTTTLHQGVFHAAFEWDGVNWRGPSDTLNPKGAAFPAGSYRLDITAKGYRGPRDAGSAVFNVSAAFGINLID